MIFAPPARAAVGSSSTAGHAPDRPAGAGVSRREVAERGINGANTSGEKRWLPQPYSATPSCGNCAFTRSVPAWQPSATIAEFRHSALLKKALTRNWLGIFVSNFFLLGSEQQPEVADAAGAGRAVHLQVGSVENVGDAGLQRGVPAFEDVARLGIHGPGRKRGGKRLWSLGKIRFYLKPVSLPGATAIARNLKENSGPGQGASGLHLHGAADGLGNLCPTVQRQHPA